MNMNGLPANSGDEAGSSEFCWVAAVSQTLQKALLMPANPDPNASGVLKLIARNVVLTDPRLTRSIHRIFLQGLFTATGTSYASVPPTSEVVPAEISSRNRKPRLERIGTLGFGRLWNTYHQSV
ncbi:hypothetical protein B0H14DRAFT_2651521 [Mycena olivaceomarginata]|nr:hypothetical protein B0H14DRAFT_2651521 [Mycena olivaceomarginata]